jgi:O-antigen ligase
MISAKKILIIYSLIFQLVFCFKDNIFDSDFIDLYPTWISAKLYVEGNKDSIYSNSAYGTERSKIWIEKEKEILTHGSDETNFVYFPTYIYPFAILSTILSYSIFKLLFLILNVILISYLISSYLIKLNMNIFLKYIIISIILISDPVRDILKFGQNVPLLLVFLRFYYINISKNRFYLSIFDFIILCTIKPWAIIFGILPLVKRNWKIVFGLSISLIIYLLFQFIFENQLFIGFIDSLEKHSKINILAINNISIYAFLIRLLYLNPGSQNILTSWETLDINEGFLVKFFILYIFISISFIAFISKSKKLQHIVFNFTPFLLNNIFWNHYLLLYTREFLRPPFTNIFIYSILTISVLLNKVGVQIFIDLIIKHIFKLNIVLDIIIFFPILFLITKGTISIYNILSRKNLLYILKFIPIPIFFFLYLYIFILEGRSINTKFNYIGFYLLFSLTIFHLKNKINIKVLSFLYISAFYLLINYYFSALYLPDVGISNIKIYIQSFSILLLISLYFTTLKYKSIDSIFVFTVIANTTLFNSFLYNSPGYKFTFLIIYLSIYILFSDIKIYLYQIFLLLIVYIINIYSSVPYDSIMGSSLIITLILLHIISNNKDFLKKSYLFNIILQIFLLTLSLFFIFSIIYIINNNYSNSIYWFGFHINSLGGFFAFYSTILIMNISKTSEFKYNMKLYNIFYLILLVILLLLLLLTKSRSNIIGLIIYIISYFIFFKYQRKNIAYIGIAILFLIIIIIILYKENIFNFNINSIQARVIIFKYLFKLVIDKSILTGFGFDSTTIFMHYPFNSDFSFFVDFFKNHGIHLHAHNLFLQIFVSTGLLGLSTSIFMLIILISAIISKIKEKDFIFRFILLLFILVQSFFDFTLTDCFIIIPLSLIVLPKLNFKSDLKFMNIKSFNKIITLLSICLYFFMNSILISNYFYYVEWAKPGISYKPTGSIEIKSSLTNKDYNSISTIDHSVFFKILKHYPLEQLLGEISYKKYTETNEIFFLNKSNDYYEKCIKDNKFNTMCYSRLVNNYIILKENNKVELLRSKCSEIDPNHIFNDDCDYEIHIPYSN